MNTQIRALRTLNKLTQRGLATLVGTSQQSLQRIEAGRSCPSLGMAGRICGALHAPPCAVFPQLASGCAGPPHLRALHSSEDAFSPQAAATWQIQIVGADERWMNYWVCEAEAHRIQESLARYNSASPAVDSNFLAFRTTGRAVAVNLNVIDRLSLEFWGADDPLRRTPPSDTTDVQRVCSKLHRCARSRITDALIGESRISSSSKVCSASLRLQGASRCSTSIAFSSHGNSWLRSLSTSVIGFATCLTRSRVRQGVCAFAT